MLTLSGPGFCWVPGPGVDGTNSKTIHGIGAKFGRIVEYHKLITLV